MTSNPPPPLSRGVLGPPAGAGVTGTSKYLKNGSSLYDNVRACTGPRGD